MQNLEPDHGLLPRISLSHFRHPLGAQVWNSNRHTGLLGVFHLQGAAWSRRKRQFLVHDASPPPLTTQVRVADVEPLLPAGASAGRCVTLMLKRLAPLPATLSP